MNKVTILIITSALCTLHAYGMYQQPAMPYDSALSQSQEVTINFGPFQGHQQPHPPTVVATAPPAEYAPLPQTLRSGLLASERRASSIALIESIGSTQGATNICTNLTGLLACNFFKNLYLTFGGTPAQSFAEIPLASLISLGADYILCVSAIGAGYAQEKSKINKETELLKLLDQLDQVMRLDTPSTLAENRANHPSFKRSRSIILNNDCEYETIPAPTVPQAVHEQQAQEITLYKENGKLKTSAQLYALVSTLLGAICVKDLLIFRNQKGATALNTAIEGTLAIGSLYLSYTATEKQHEQEEQIRAYESGQLP
jgi:hypothetical protein